MGVAEDAESPVHEEDLLFGEPIYKAKLPGGIHRYFCVLATVLGSLLAFAVGLCPAVASAMHDYSIAQQMAPPSCSPTSTCELWSLFFDEEIHQIVAENLVSAAAPTLSRADLPLVSALVRESFGNISLAIHDKAPKVAEEFQLLKINGTIKAYIADAMGLVANPHVQGFGRQVAEAIRASPMSFKDEDDLKRHIVKNLWHRLDELQRFQRDQVNWHTQALWSLGVSSQWDMTLDVEAMGWVEAVRRGSLEKPLTAATIGVGLSALTGGALAEGRTLLDLMLMCVRSKGPSWDTNLHRAKEAFSGHLSSPCAPELTAGQSIDLRRSLVCPLKFGMLGADALRYVATLRDWPEEAGCRKPGLCPLRGLFFDEEVHKDVARSLVGLGVPLLQPRDTDDVVKLVGQSFRQISAALQRHAPRVGDELNELSMNATTRKQLLHAMALVRDPQVQSVGRFVARSLAEGRPYSGAPRLKEHLAKSLEGQQESIRQLLQELVSGTLDRVWSWAHSRQWELAIAVNQAEVFGAGSLANPAIPSATERDSAITDGALEQGRTLLDVLLMCLRSEPSRATALGQAEELFAAPLAAHCQLESSTGNVPSFGSTMVCPLKFGMLGLDALRFVQSLPVKVERSCEKVGACALNEVFQDKFIQERAVADIIGAAADPSMLLGRSELPQVRRAVVKAFGNISTTMRKQTPELGEALSRVQVNETVKQYIFEALQLMTDLHVQEIGRHVARALRSDSGSSLSGLGAALASPRELRVAVVRNLWRSFPEIQRLQATVARYAVRTVWRSASSPQLELTYELEARESREALDVPTGGLGQAEALQQAAWQEARALLDVSAAFVHRGLALEEALSLEAFPPPPLRRCDPDMKISRQAGFQSALVCPLRFGIIGMDVLRFTDSIFTWTQVDQRSCKDRGMCPLSRFFFDDFVRAAASTDILRLAADRVEAKEVEQAVDLALRNVSVHVHLYSPGVAENLLAEQADETQKERFIAAMQLVSDPKVQAFGRQVAIALRVASGFSNREELKAKIVELLGTTRLEAMRNYSLDHVDDRVLRVWRWGRVEQWSMVVDTETINSVKAATTPQEGKGGGLQPTVAEALNAAALVEGRVLLDLLMMRINSLHTSLSSNLFGTMDVFAPALSVRCALEEPSPDSDSGDLRQLILCPLRFGALGTEALRYSVSQSQTVVADGV